MYQIVPSQGVQGGAIITHPKRVTLLHFVQFLQNIIMMADPNGMGTGLGVEHGQHQQGGSSGTLAQQPVQVGSSSPYWLGYLGRCF